MLSVLSHREMNSRGKVLTAPRKTQQTGGGVPGAKEIVEMYNSHGYKLGVPDMRKFMKTMVAEVFYEDKFSAIHKCRGIWKEKPRNWDENIPFCDPNNAERPEESKTKKPSRKTLTTMMKYLITKYEENQSVKNMGAMSLEEPERKTEGGNVLAQSSDWMQQQQQEQQYFNIQKLTDDVCCKSEKLEPFEMMSQPDCSGAMMESSGHGVMEESTFHDVVFEEFDLVEWSNESSPLSDNQQCAEEVGGATEVNFNVQPRQNDITQVPCQIPSPIKLNYEPARQLPPPNNQVQGMSVSDGGVLQTSHTGAAFSGGEVQAQDDLADVDMAELIYENIDPSQFANIMKGFDPNFLPMMENSQPMMQNSQPFMENSQPMMENSQPMMECYSLGEPAMEMNGPMEESSAQAVIPTVVQEYDN